MTGSNKGIKILLIEDNTGDRYLLESLLDASVVKIEMIIPVDSAHDAIRLLSIDDFDIIILDLILPDSSGIDTFRLIRKYSGTTPIIILSGLKDMNIAMEAISLGAQDYLLKDDLEERMLTKSILYSIERNRSSGQEKKSDEQYLLIRKSELEAIKSQELASQVINAALDAIVCIDKYGKIIAWNPQAIALFGWQQNEILGKTLTETIIPPEYKEVHELGMKIYLETGKAPFLNKVNEIVTADKTGKKIPVEFSFVKIVEEDSQFYCAFIRDISIRKNSQSKTEESIRNKLALGELNKALNRVQNFEEVFELAMDAAQTIFSVTKTSILLVQEDSRMKYAAARNISEKYMEAAEGFNPWENDVEHILPVLISNVKDAPLVEKMLPFMEEEGIASLAYIPLTHQQKRLGRIMIYFTEEHTFTEEEIQLAESLAGNLSFAISEIAISDALKKSEIRYRTLIEQASDPIIIYSLDGKIVDYNNVFMSTTGYTKADVNNLKLSDLLFVSDLKSKPLLFEKVITGVPVHDVRNVRRKDGTAMYAELNSKMMPDGNVMVIARDITERKITENALKESESKYRTLVEQAVDAIALYNAEGIILDVNTGAANLIGYEKHELIGMSLQDILTHDEIEANPVRYDVLERGVSTVRQRKMNRKDGSVVETEVRSQQLPDGRFLSVIRDLTERLRSEKKLEESYKAIRRLTSHIQDIREEERTAIAKEIHDELGQKLTVLKMDASWLKTKIGDENESVKKRVSDLISMLDETVGTVRRISLELRPSLLDDLGLVPAMEWHLGEFEKRFNIVTNFVHEINEADLSDAVKTSFFRIFQESLTNVARHSLAGSVTVLIVKKENNLILSIEDNGVGFNKQDIAERKALGILGMEERMTMIGGKYVINSEKGKGTEVLVQLQLN